MTMDLAEFLLARMNEDERRALSMKRIDPLRPDPFGPIEQRAGRRYDEHGRDVTEDYAKWVASMPDAPDTRALAECEAKRRIIVRCQKHCDEMQMSGAATAVHLATATLADLALPYAGHPDYREEWVVCGGS